MSLLSRFMDWVESEPDPCTICGNDAHSESVSSLQSLGVPTTVIRCPESGECEIVV